MSLSTLAERWRLFAGAILSVALGVALVQSAIQVLVATGEPEVPAGVSGREAEAIREGYAGAATLLGMTVMLAWFLAVFVVASTFAFTVAQRRRELALFRLVGAGRGRVVRLLLAEGLLLGAAGSALGVPLGIPAAWAQARLLVALGMLPDDFAAPFSGAAVAVAAPVGVGVALLGVLSAAVRAARVRPLEALRDTGGAARVMTATRWVCGLGSLALTVWMVVAAQSADVLGAVMVALVVSMTGAVALSALSPLAVPLTGRALGALLGGGPLGELARANLADGVRRGASVAAPLIVLVSLVIGLTGTLQSLALFVGEDLKRVVRGDLVVASSGAAADRIAAIPGVETVSAQFTVPVSVTATLREEGRKRRATYHAGVVAVDPAAYARTHRLKARGGLDRLRGNTVAVGPGLDGEGIRLGSTVTARVAGERRTLKVVAALPATMENYAERFLLPREIVPAGVLAKAEAESVVVVADGTDPGEVAERVRAAGIGTARTVARWAEDRSEEQQRGNVGILAALMGLAAVYALVAVVNAVVIATSERRVEFANARVTGLSRPQVVRAAVIETWAVTTIGLLLGCLVAAGALAGIRASAIAAVGRPLLAVPWGLLLALAAGAYAVSGAASAWSAWSATRIPPVRLIAARE
ncbi:FtsX-like permease family protein [Bailinhaonella thermotolerans]|uniref:FtsX-like permease family protein n=1 Tax=Bailinhaonella thermotolerans TaxID=1070861 RepID=A0A3A4A903_9ACTN|nr:FtsX-like permease family protein [Bailinhaonella thermotolerans]